MSEDLQIQQFIHEIESFDEFGECSVKTGFLLDDGSEIPVYLNEFWTAKQRAAHSLHEVSYRACFKPQLPRFFIDRLTQPDDRVFDPFMGRGTTLIEAALLGRKIGGCDVNPLSRFLLKARLHPPEIEQVESRLRALDLKQNVESSDPLLVFFHPDTLSEIAALRHYLLSREQTDLVDDWIRMVATNRLTGHSPGFLSVYTLPPNQAVSVASQKRINERRNQVPQYRSLVDIVLKKSRSLLKNCEREERDRLNQAGQDAELVLGSADNICDIEDNRYQLVVTSPPFLDVINYQQDNWLRCWFNGIDSSTVPIWQLRKLEDWKDAMLRVLKELHRILEPGGFVAFEVGEVRKGSIKLEEVVANLALRASFTVRCILVNSQNFTKTSACWGVDNLKKGTNSNRIVVMQKQRTASLEQTLLGLF